MTDQKNMSLTQSMNNSRKRGIRAAHAKAAERREQIMPEEAEGYHRKYGNGRGTRRPGRIDEVPPFCFRAPGMTDDQATVAAVTAMGITSPVGVLLVFFALRAEGSTETESAANEEKPHLFTRKGHFK